MCRLLVELLVELVFFVELVFRGGGGGRRSVGDPLHALLHILE